MSFIPEPVIATCIVFACIAAGVLGVRFVHGRIPVESRIENNETAGFIYATLGVVYAVVLAFVIVVVWEQLQDAERTVEHETNALGDIVRNAQGLTPDVAKTVHADVIDYINVVLAEEWSAMGDGSGSRNAVSVLYRLWRHVSTYTPTTPKEELYYREVVREMNEATDQRRMRILSARAAVPPVMWVLLITGGVVTISFSFFFGSKRVGLQKVMVGALAGMIGLSLYLIQSIDHPFGQGVRVSSDSFMHILEHLKDAAM